MQQAAVITEVVATAAVAVAATVVDITAAVLPITEVAVADIVAGFKENPRDHKPIKHSVPKSS
jgi:hypothetical protein